MALIDWNDDLSVNIKEVDQEHKKLINLINSLHSAMGSGQGKKAMGPVLAGLVDYTKTHFAFEEQLMRKNRYPGYLNHKSLHDSLTEQVVELNNKYQEGKTLVTVEVLAFLKDWLTNHIKTVDKKYGPYLNAKGVV